MADERLLKDKEIFKACNEDYMGGTDLDYCCAISKAQDTKTAPIVAQEIFDEIETLLDLHDETYVRISNHVAFEEWQSLKSRFLLQGKISGRVPPVARSELHVDEDCCPNCGVAFTGGCNCEPYRKESGGEPSVPKEK